MAFLARNKQIFQISYHSGMNLVSPSVSFDSEVVGFQSLMPLWCSVSLLLMLLIILLICRLLHLMVFLLTQVVFRHYGMTVTFLDVPELSSGMWILSNLY